MKRTLVSSSVLVSIGYDEESRTLEIEFHGGSIYQYYGVHASVYNGLMSASSRGQYFERNIKEAGYPYKKIE